MTDRIMVIDDDDDFSEYLAVLLAGAGYVVDTFSNAQEALDSVGLVAPSLILCDLVMPGMDGFQFIHKFRHRYPDGAHIPVVLISAKNNITEVIKAKFSGADDFIAKPINQALFLATVTCRLEQISRIRKGDLAFNIFRSEGNRTGKDHDLYKTMCAALEAGEFCAHYQPKVSRDGVIHGAEALARWIHDGKTVLPPNTFIPIAERYGLILPLTDSLLNQIKMDVENWDAKGPSDINISVNLSPVHFSFENFRNIIEHIPSKIFNQISFEITETSLLGNIDKVGDLIRHAVESGSQIFIDDFGTGFSSLSYLQNLPVTGLKVDKSFVDNCVTDSRSGALVKSILDLAAIFDLDIVAEGVENEDQKAFLFDAGYDELQGFLFSPAVSSTHFEKHYIAPNYDQLPKPSLGMQH
ncbi:MAG: EAL domain-containing response regulator [Magnetovibrio sp.]|nr:EAL domain-containing response regulator [Magnetovibrio sp.]